MTEHPLLARLSKGGMRMGLSRIRAYLEWLGNPHLRYPVIHVAGTNGKGSVCRMVGAMLSAQGYRVGITTSPHLQNVNERILIGETPISDASLDALLQRLCAQEAAWARSTLPPDDPYPLTYFELSTAAAFQHFADQQVDIAVVEVGMGGRLDASNVVSPVVCAIITIGLDHTEQLGPDHASIAAEKAGILKKGVPAVIGPLPPPAMAVTRAVAAERGVPLKVFGEHFSAFGAIGNFRYQSQTQSLEGLSLSLSGDHQMINAAVSLQIMELLPSLFPCSEAALRTGLQNARNPGRLEWLSADLLVDGAHNPEGALVLANFLAQLPHQRRRTLVLGGGSDKDIRSVATTLAPHVDQILTTACDHPKARSPEDISRQIQGLTTPISIGGPLEEALPAALASGDLVIVAGSLYLVGAVRSWMEG